MLKKTKIIILIIVVICIIYTVWVILVPIKNILTLSNESYAIAQKINKDIDRDDFVALNKDIYSIKERVALIKNNLYFFVFVKIIPPLGDKYEKTMQSINDIEIICNSANKILESSRDIGKMDKNSILISFLNNPEEYRKISKHFNDLSSNIYEFSNIIHLDNSEFVQNINLIAKILKVTEPISSNILDIIGQNGERRYLLLFQNNTELRATGGFIGTYGILSVEKGKIKKIYIDDIYHLDVQSIGKLNNSVPEPIKKYLKTEEWYMRDCNWQIAFADSARDCLNIYELERKNLDNKNPDNLDIYNNNQGNIDGVIALNPDLVGEALKIIGDQEISGIIFEGQNFTDDLQKAVELYYKERGVSQWDRKNIIKDLAKSILEDLKKSNTYEYGKMTDLIIEKLENKDIILYSKNPEIQNKLSNAGWTGDVVKSDNDYIMLVDSNLASFKSDQFIDRTVNYELSKDKNNSLMAKVSITYKHNGGFSWNSTKYRDYVRLLVPLGSEFINISGFTNEENNDQIILDKSEMYGKVSYGSFITVEPKASKTLIFEYKLPDYVKNQINEKQYKLYIQKQSGVKNLNYIISANFNEDFRKLKINTDSILNNNIFSVTGKKTIIKDTLIEMTW